MLASDTTVSRPLSLCLTPFEDAQDASHENLPRPPEVRWVTSPSHKTTPHQSTLPGSKGTSVIVESDSGLPCALDLKKRFLGSFETACMSACVHEWAHACMNGRRRVRLRSVRMSKRLTRVHAC